MYLTVRNVADVEQHADIVRKSSGSIQEWFAANIVRDSFSLIRCMKFDPIGRHPIDHRALNLIEQINQTLTFAVALEAARKLLELHYGEAFKLAPGAHAALDLDIMSETAGLVGAEVFAAVDPRNNQKLQRDRAKLQKRSEQHRYLFFMSPRYPGTQRLTQYEVPGVQVWSIDF